MAKLEHDLLLKLDPADHDALLAARIAERDATIAANDAARKQARATAKSGAGSKDATDAAKAKDDATALAAAHEAAHAARVAAVKAAYAAADLECGDEGHDLARGLWAMKAEAKREGLGPIIDRRLPLSDAQCDEWTASYRASTRAGFEATDLQRQIGEYEAAHPKIDGEPGGVIPEPEPLLALRAALKAKQDLISSEQAKQWAICAAVYAAAGVKREEYSYWREIDVAAGEIVVGRNPLLTKYDQVELEPAGGGAVIR